MALTEAVVGTFVAYTQGGGQAQKPTLYFTKGRYTQVHDHANNVGFHPNHPGQFTANISLANLGIITEHKRQLRHNYKKYNDYVLAAEQATKMNAKPEVSQILLKAGEPFLSIYVQKLAEINVFCESYRQGAFTADPTDISSKCFEVSPPRASKTNWITHQSRGRLIYPNDPTFDKTFNAEYIRNVLRNGHYAANVPAEDLPKDIK